MALLIDGVAIITGAGKPDIIKPFHVDVSLTCSKPGSGIGQECALAYAAEGARGVVLADMNYSAAMEAARASEAVATNPGYEALAFEVNVCDVASVEAMIKTAMKRFSRIDYSVNSAGVGVQNPLPFEDADPAEMTRFWQINVMGTFNCVQAVSKAMKEQSVRVVSTRRREREVGRGVILNLGSANSYMATPNIVQYTTSKHAVLGLTKNAALDLAPHAIRVNAICPGWVGTPMVDAAIDGDPNLPKMMKTVIPMSRIAKPEEIADVVLFMTSPRSSYVTGAGWIVDGGLTLQLQAC